MLSSRLRFAPRLPTAGASITLNLCFHIVKHTRRNPDPVIMALLSSSLPDGGHPSRLPPATAPPPLVSTLSPSYTCRPTTPSAPCPSAASCGGVLPFASCRRSPSTPPTASPETPRPHLHPPPAGLARPPVHTPGRRWRRQRLAAADARSPAAGFARKCCEQLCGGRACRGRTWRAAAAALRDVGPEREATRLDWDSIAPANFGNAPHGRAGRRLRRCFFILLVTAGRLRRIT